MNLFLSVGMGVINRRKCNCVAKWLNVKGGNNQFSDAKGRRHVKEILN